MGVRNIDRFEPALYSLEENMFLQEHIGESPNIALGKGTPPGVNPKAVRPVLQRVYDLNETEKHSGESWAGLEVLKGSISVYVDALKEWTEDKAKGAPYPPTTFEWDSRGRARQGGVGSDAHVVNTYFDEEGNRHALGINLIPTNVGQKYQPRWVRDKMKSYKVPDQLIHDESLGRFTCPICQHTESYDPENSRALNAARGRMANHMLKTNRLTDDHRASHAAIFRSGGKSVS